MPFALLLLETADPAGSRVVSTVSAEEVVNLVDQAQCKIFVFLAPRLPIKLQEVADSKSVGP
jgi:hypothetical protein